MKFQQVLGFRTVRAIGVCTREALDICVYDILFFHAVGIPDLESTSFEGARVSLVSHTVGYLQVGFQRIPRLCSVVTVEMQATKWSFGSVLDHVLLQVRFQFTLVSTSFHVTNEQTSGIIMLNPQNMLSQGG